jgi:hypothetical protein
MSNDQTTEQLVAQHGANLAPRITPEDLQANIVHVEYIKHVSHSGQVLRWCILTTRSGYAVTGRPSVSVSPLNDKAQVGEKVAYENAVAELWPLMGYHLRMTMNASTPGLITDTDRLQLLLSAVSENPPEIPDEVLDTVLGASGDQDATPEQIIKVIDAAILYLRSMSPQATATSQPVFNTEGPDDFQG